MSRPFDERRALQYNPFEGDFGGSGDRTMKDKIGVARVEGPCQDCAQTILPGERVRLRTEFFDGEMRSYRWCNLCCAAQAASWDDNGAAIDARFALRSSAP